MSVLSPEERNDIAVMHGVPANNRDASQGWTRAPTKIFAPMNPTSHRGGTTNPYANRTKDTLNQPRGGNPAAQSTVLAYSGGRGQPPAKRAKVDSNIPPRSRKKVSQPSNELSRRKLGQPDDTDLIYVDDEYEDIGLPVMTSPSDADDLNIGPSRARPSAPPLSSGSSRHSHPIPDGEHTKHLRERPLLAPETDSREDSDDPIEASEPEPSTVRRIIHQIEQKNSHPKLDLVEQRKLAKNRMKPKNPVASAPPAAPAPPPKPTATNKSPDNHFLPIRAWYLGHKYFDEAYHLGWASNGKMTIKSGDFPGPAARHKEELDIRTVAKTVWFVEPNERYQNKVFVLETYPKPKSKHTDKVIGAQFPLLFKQGAGSGSPRGMGEIMIKFNSASPAWEDAIYKAFVEWLKSKVDSRETLRGKAGDSKWEAASRIAQLSEARARRESGDGSASATPKAIPTTTKPSAVPGLPSINDWSPPARVAEPPWVSERQGSPSTPIEIESPPRPAPRPTYRGPDSVSVGGGLQHVRRSARQSVAPQKPYVDPDEVILVYPPGQTGAVNITNGDVTRLAPGEFLNDTLIEFGLKLWLQELEKENPELVKQIHVFSSFFYKKLNKKNTREGYESVRKWTSKFDLFDKKYIIVPINENLHWYLAIIYHPEHTLLPPPPTKSPSTRLKARQVAETSPELDQRSSSRREKSSKPPDSKASSVTRRTPTPVETNVGSRGDSETLSPSSNANAQVDEIREVHNQLVSSCTITDDDAPAPGFPDNQEGCATDEETNSLFDGDCAMDVDIDIPDAPGVAREQSPPLAVSAVPTDDAGSHTASEGPAPPDPEVMDIDAQGDVANQSMDPMNLFANDSPARSASVISEAVKPLNFYGSSAKSKGKRKAESPPVETFPPQESLLETYEDDTEDVVVGGQPRTYVFTLDSLGSRHPKAVTVLGQYLQYEAQEKKGISMDRSSKPIGKMALVPHQPNFCDCGIYLLHLAQTFISDPLHYFHLITTKKGNTNSSERQTDWKDEHTKNLREALTRRIEELSIEWKKERAVKEELKKEELKKKQEDVVPDSSDDDIDIVDTTPATPAPQPKEKQPRTTGKALRMRG